MKIDANGKLETNGYSQNVAARLEVGNSGEGTSVARGIGNVSDGCQEAVQVQQQQQQQQRSQGSMVHWETFLHITSIRVLLVENDDSTRHVVAALLRNLNYEVIVAANGLQAWRILEDLANHIDIVLTEVVMPCLSGIGLLCKIMSHKTRKNIPVIMMSSHDSMGLVFKCLSKGAVDFLGKPIRKNELKNLWQHVWRRCHSSSGSGGESRTHTQISVKSKNGVKSEKNRNSVNEGDNMSTGLKTDGTDEDSDSQSSWTKEVDSSQAMSSKDQIAKRSHSTCAQLCTHAETSTETMVPVTAVIEYHKNDIDEHNDSVYHGRDSLIEKSKTLQQQLNNTNEVPSKLTDTNRITNALPEPNLKKTRGGNNSANRRDHLLKRNKATITKTPSPQMAIEDYAKTSNSNIEAFEDPKTEPESELNLKRLRGSKDTGKANQTDRNVLRRTDLSAFSSSKRYNITSNGIKVPNGINVTFSQDTVKDKTDRPCLNRNLLRPSSDRGKNIVEMGSRTDKLPINPTVVSIDKLNTTSNKQEPVAAINDMELSTVFATTEMDLNRTPQQVILVKTDDLASPALLTPIKGSPRELPVQHIHHHHHVHHFHNMDREQPLTNLEGSSYNKIDEESPHLKSLDVFFGPVEGDTRNCSLNKSGSGSKHGSNGQNGSSTIVQAGGTNIESDVHIAGKSSSGDASGSGSRNRIGQNRCAHREASLTKFRQKKERRVVNKARHQNKKKLAE